MPREKTLILTKEQIQRKIVRIASEILERNYKEKELVVVGIAGRGEQLAKRIADSLEKSIAVKRLVLEVEKDDPLTRPIKLSGALNSVEGKSVVLVDDVINSGRTLIYAVRYLLEGEPKQLATATLVDRFHRRFPVHADYVGLTLSTNLKEHISVELGSKQEAVYLE
jgi:pyrimidine operon attenuation protein / uracil phosphoribosyltransferase